MTCESDFLARLQDILENAYGYAERFQARDLKLTEFDHISDMVGKPLLNLRGYGQAHEEPLSSLGRRGLC